MQVIPFTTPFKGYSIDFFVKETYLQQGKTSDGLFHGFYGWTRRENAKRQNIAGLLQTASMWDDFIEQLHLYLKMASHHVK